MHASLFLQGRVLMMMSMALTKTQIRKKLNSVDDSAVCRSNLKPRSVHIVDADNNRGV